MVIRHIITMLFPSLLVLVIIMVILIGIPFGNNPLNRTHKVKNLSFKLSRVVMGRYYQLGDQLNTRYDK
jgi:hypothetical protein